MEILFIAKKNDPDSIKAAEYIKQVFPDTIVLFGIRGEKFPEELLNWKGDFVFSYLSPWIIPQSLLDGATQGAVNWHPGPPEYPGIGCTNFAIYNEEKVFGITCHYMLNKVDTGKIIEVQRFAVLAEDSVYSITQKCYALILNSFYRIVELIAKGEPLPVSKETWQRKPFTRKELNALCEIQPGMTKTEMEKRIKATTYDKPWAFVELNGIKFYSR